MPSLECPYNKGECTNHLYDCSAEFKGDASIHPRGDNGNPLITFRSNNNDRINYFGSGHWNQ